MGLSDLFSKIQATKSASVQSGRGGGGGRAGGLMRATNPRPVKAVRVEAKPQRISTAPMSKGRRDIANKVGRGGGKGGKAGGGRGGGKRGKSLNSDTILL